MRGEEALRAPRPQPEPRRQKTWLHQLLAAQGRGVLRLSFPACRMGAPRVPMRKSRKAPSEGSAKHASPSCFSFPPGPPNPEGPDWAVAFSSMFLPTYHPPPHHRQEHCKEHHQCVAVISSLGTTLGDKSYYYAHFTEETVEAQKGSCIQLGSTMVELELRG